MIRFMRRSLAKKHIFTGIVWLSVFSIVGISSITLILQQFFGKETSGSLIGRVNGYPITNREYAAKVAEEERHMAYFRKQFGAQASSFMENMGMRGRPEEQALNALIKQKLLISCADACGIAVSEEELTRKLQDPLFLVKSFGDVIFPYLISQQGGIDYNHLLAYLKSQGISRPQVQTILENSLKESVVLTLANGALYVPLYDIKERFIRDVLAKKFTIATLPLSFFEQEVRKQEVPEQSLQTYFNEENGRSKRYWTPEKRSGIAWIITPQQYSLTVHDKDIQDYYLRNKKNFIAQEEQRDTAGKVTQPLVYKELASVKETIKKLVEAEKFQRLFTLETQGVLGKEKDEPGSVRSFLERKQARKVTLSQIGVGDSRYSGALFSLAPAGKKSFVEDGEGVVIELESIMPSVAPSFALVKGRVKNEWYKEKAREALAAALDEVALSFMVSPSTGEKAKKYGGSMASASIETTGFLDPSKQTDWEKIKKQGLPSEKMALMANTADVLKEVGAEKGYVIRIAAFEPFNEEKFASAAPALRTRIMNEQRGIFDQAFIDSLHKNATIDLYRGTSTL
jgi:SurA-like N-terminal domain